MTFLAAAIWIGSMAAQAKAPPASPTPARTPLQEAATQARLAGRVADAISKYKQALQVSPSWSEGWYYLGVITYEQDRARDCTDAFTRFVKLQPKVAAGFAFLGLCLYKSADYRGALSALDRAERIGLPAGEQLTDVVNYHAALLYTKGGNFERALQMLDYFARRDAVEPKLIELAGIAGLRRPIFPPDLPAEDRELIYRVGRAVMTVAERRVTQAFEMFDELKRDFPAALNLHYLYGSFLLGAAELDAAIREFEAELKLQPDHLPSLVVIGLQHLKKNDFAQALQYGERAVRLAPGNCTAQALLGRALVEGDLDVPRGVAALERAVGLEPESPQVRFALASAYAKAGRKEDAAKQRVEFLRLKKQTPSGGGTP
jgi:cytochrome c-type biogenesis protein CcmH/NrfG